MLAAVATAARILNDARMIVEVLTDLLSANTNCDINFEVCEFPSVLFVAACENALEVVFE